MGLALEPNGCYVDATFGGGGHSEAILSKLKGGRLYAFDQDREARSRAEKLKLVEFLPENFRNMATALSARGVRQVSGILADLGMSTQQLYHPERGFGAMHSQATLDMRMCQEDGGETASDVLNNASYEELKRIFSDYAQLEGSGRLARSVVIAREKRRLQTVGELKELLQRHVPRKQPARFWARFFQALRIAVNDELEALKALLRAASHLLVAGGRLVVLSYHSLEDRLVKRFLRYGHFGDTCLVDDYGRPLSLPFSSLYKKPLCPSPAECAENPSARSAKLRVGIRQ